MTEHPFLILCGGDTAEADDLDSAVTAARTLREDQGGRPAVTIQRVPGYLWHVVEGEEL